MNYHELGAAIEAVGDANARDYGDENISKVLIAARAYLTTLPRTKMIDVWRVEWAILHQAGDGSKTVIPQVQHFFDKDKANSRADDLRGWADVRCIHVTGPHKQQVPA